MVKVVEKRNEIIECLEMDRIREAAEDDSINTHLTNFTLKREEKLEEPCTKNTKKKSKKEKKFKIKNLPKFDIDKDIDETEVTKVTSQPEKGKQKKKKKFNLF